jgi:hypothetical protein
MRSADGCDDTGFQNDATHVMRETTHAQARLVNPHHRFCRVPPVARNPLPAQPSQLAVCSDPAPEGLGDRRSPPMDPSAAEIDRIGALSDADHHWRHSSLAPSVTGAIRSWRPSSLAPSLNVSNPRGAASKISERKKVWFLASTCSLRGLPPQYHRRCSVSQPSSRWIGVGPLRHGHQEHFPFHRVNPENCIGFRAGGHPLTPNPTSVNKLRCPPHNPPPVLRQALRRWTRQQLETNGGQALGLLVLLCFTHYCAST